MSAAFQQNMTTVASCRRLVASKDGHDKRVSVTPVPIPSVNLSYSNAMLVGKFKSSKRFLKSNVWLTAKEYLQENGNSSVLYGVNRRY